MLNQLRHSCEISNFMEFLEECLRGKILSYTLSPMTKPGDNYGSVIQAVEVKVVGNREFDEVKFKKENKTIFQQIQFKII